MWLLPLECFLLFSVLFCMYIPLFDRGSLPFILDLGGSEPTGLLGMDIY